MDRAHAACAHSYGDSDAVTHPEADSHGDTLANPDPESDAERAYVNARKYEKFGDSFTAIEKYEAMQTLIDSDDESRPYLNLARHRAELIRKGADTKADRTAFVEAQLKKADEQFLQGDKVQAREKWQSIVKLYSDTAAFDAIVARAKARVIDAESALKAEAQP